MQVEANKETLCINQIIGQKNDTTIIEEDFVVPDIKPDILSCIDTSGTVCIYKKEIMDGKIKIEGSINTYIMYLAENEENSIRSMNVNLDFSHVIDFNGLKIGMMVDLDTKIRQIECRVLNGRKINVRAFVDINITAYSNEKIDFLNSIDSIKDIQLLKSGIGINSLLGTGNTKIFAKDTIVIDNIDELAEIMKVGINICNKETKISYNKILLKADLCLKIMYLTMDNRICTKSAKIPIMGFIDMPDISDDNICDVKYEIKNILIKPNSMEEHSIYVEIEIDAYASCYTTKNIDLIQDLYSPSVNLCYKQNNIKSMSHKNTTIDVCPIRENQKIDELNGCKIYDVDVKPNIIKQNIDNGRITFEGETELKFIYSTNNNSMISSKNIVIPFNYNMNCPGVDSNSSVDTMIEVMTQDFVIMTDESIDIKMDLQFIVNSFKNENLNVIQEINIEENRDQQRHSLIVYFTKTGDTLWKIAKRFRSTIDAIAELNGIENVNDIGVGRQLFIPMAH